MWARRGHRDTRVERSGLEAIFAGGLAVSTCVHCSLLADYLHV